jgi:hypothetical protein
MIRFVSKLIIFLSPFLLLLGLVEHRLALTPTSYKVKRSYLEQNIAKAQVIVTGSSHSYFGIKPQMLGAPAFSIAYVSQDIYYDTRILLKYLPQATNAKVVIIPISYFTLEIMLEDSPEVWRTSYYYEFWDIAHASPGFRIADHSLIALYGVQQSRSWLWSGIPITNPEAIDESGGTAGMGGTNVASVMDARTTLKRHSSGMKLQYAAQNRHYLEELFNALRARGISIVIITTPCFHSYYENMDHEVYALMQDEIQSLRRTYGLEYRNYLTDSRFTMDDFADSDHLSTVGAEKFSRILKDEVVREYIK